MFLTSLLSNQSMWGAFKGQEIAQLYDIKPDGKVKITLKLTDEQKKYTNLQIVYIAIISHYNDNFNILIGIKV